MSTNDLLNKMRISNIDFLDIASRPIDNLMVIPKTAEPPQFEKVPFVKHIEKTEQYQEKSLQVLESINQNTANLFLLVDLINKSNDKQDIIIELISDVLSMSKAKDKEEVDSLYQKVMGRITSLVEDGETLCKICSYATTVYTMVNTFFK